jgi:hypothetical protein
MPWNWQSRLRCDEESGLGAGSLRNGSERDPANTRHTIEPVPLGPIGEFGWKAAIRSGRLKLASAP